MKMAWSLGLLLLAAACGDKSQNGDKTSAPPGSITGDGDGAGAGAPEQASESSAQAAERGPKLAASPQVDLIANRYLWHMARAGLVIPFASEGLRKYVQEYGQPWGPVVSHDGKPGRVLSKRAADVIFGVGEAGDTRVVFRMAGLSGGQRMSLRLNGKIVANLNVEAGWSTVEATLPLIAGENALQLLLSQRGNAAGHASYGLFHSLEISPAGSSVAEAWPALAPVRKVAIDADERVALAGFANLGFYVELPASAHLVFETSADLASSFTVVATTADGKSHSLLEAQQAAGVWTPRRIALDQLADQLVHLELRSRGPVAYSRARLAVEEATVHPKPAPVDNVILFVVDALRSDKLAVYQDTRVKTPRITAEAGKRGVAFLNNQAASPSSPPSHGSIQTGMIPRVHGVTGDSGKLYPGTPMISNQAVAGKVDAAYYGNNPFGMGRLEAPGNWTEYHVPPKEGKGIDCTALVEGMLDFAGRTSKASRRFFISSLPYEPHTPYRYHGGVTDFYYPGPYGPPVGKSVDGVLLGGLSAGKVTLTDDQWKQLRALYDGEVEHMDGCFGQLIDGLDALGIGDKTAVVLTSDHGEGMYEHGKMGHAFGHFRELGDVPLIVFASGWPSPGRKIDVVTSHLDIAPTVLDLLGIEPSAKIQGVSVLPLMLREGPWTHRVMPLEYGRSYSLRSRRWKIIADYQNVQSAFDLEADPTEQDDLIAKSPIAVRYLRDLTGVFLAHRSEWHMQMWGELNNHSAAAAAALDKLSDPTQ